ncbi:MAG: RagB/SusD family nutrient uptake outer membrane protein, partial [Alistipes sp.]
MRKLLNIIGLSAAVLLTSCDMDKIPQGSLDQGEAFKDLKTVEYLANGAYARLRDNYGIENMILPDIQADYVNALSGYSNTYGEVYKWIFTQNDYDVTAAWEVCYMTIAQCNFIIDGIDKNIDNFKPKDQPALDLINGRMFLMRAMSYSMLAERFCADYNAATATKEFSGVPIIPNYNPDEKPSRATLAQVYDAILADIAQAKVYLKKTAGSPSAIYLNIDCVTALEARVYLQMDKYPEALAAANSLINNGKYALATSLDEFDDVWTYDRGKEVIFKFAASKTELPPAYGGSFFSEGYGGAGAADGVYYWSVDYIPTQDVVDMYDKDDYRGKSWIYMAKTTSDFNSQCWAGGDYLITPG